MLPFVGLAAKGEAVDSVLWWELSLQGEPITGSTQLPGVILHWWSMQEEGGEGEVGEWAGPVKGNSVTSSLLQNKSDANVIEKNHLLQMKYSINILTVYKFHEEN